MNKNIKTIKSALGQRPKQPIRPFSLYVQEQFNRNRENGVQLSAPQTLEQAARNWRAMADEAKQKYIDACKGAWDEYKKALAAWKQQEAALKKPPSPYANFVKDVWEAERASENPRTFVEVSKHASSIWNTKAAYKRRFDDDKQEYCEKIRRLAEEVESRLSTTSTSSQDQESQEDDADNKVENLVPNEASVDELFMNTLKPAESCVEGEGCEAGFPIQDDEEDGEDAEMQEFSSSSEDDVDSCGCIDISDQSEIFSEVGNGQHAMQGNLEPPLLAAREDYDENCQSVVGHGSVSSDSGNVDEHDDDEIEDIQGVMEQDSASFQDKVSADEDEQDDDGYDEDPNNVDEEGSASTEPNELNESNEIAIEGRASSSNAFIHQNEDYGKVAEAIDGLAEQVADLADQVAEVVELLEQDAEENNQLTA